MNVQAFLSLLVFTCLTLSGSMTSATPVKALSQGAMVVFTQPTKTFVNDCSSLQGVAFAACQTGKLGFLPQDTVAEGARAVVEDISRTVRFTAPFVRENGFLIYLTLQNCPEGAACRRIILVTEEISFRQNLSHMYTWDRDLEVSGVEVLAQ